MGQVKGNGSHFVNHLLASSEPFAWQAEIGVVSFDGKRLDKVVQCVKTQRLHQLEGSTIQIFEKVADEDQ